jgi:hypothetical protein
MSGLPATASRGRRGAAVHLLLAAFVFLFAWLFRYNDPSGSFGGLTDDHFFYVVRGWQMLFGELPTRDFVDHGAPGYFYLSAAVQAVIGRGTWSELIFSTTMLAFGASLTFWLGARASGSILFGLIGVLFHIYLGPRFYNYPKILVYALAIPAVWAFIDRPDNRRVLLVALVTAFGFMLRHDHGAFVGVMMLTALIVMRGVPLLRRLRHAIVYAVLVVALLSPYLAFVQLHGGLPAYFRGAAAWAERDRGRAEVVWPGLFDNPDGVSDEAQQGSLLQRARASYHDNYVAWQYYLMLALPCICLAALLVGRNAFRRDWPAAAEKIGVVAVLGTVLNAGFFRHPLEARLADPSVPHAILVAWLGASLVRAWFRRDRLRPLWARHAWTARVALLVIAAPVVVLVAALLSDDAYRRLDKSSMAERPGKAFERAGYITDLMRHAWPVDVSAAQEGDMKLAAYVRACTAPSDRILVTPYLPQVVAMADRGFAGGHADLRAGNYNTEEDQRLTIARLQKQSVPMVIFAAGEEPGFRESFPLIVRYIEEHYVSAGVREIDDDIELFVEKNRAPRRRWEPLDWPCFE